MIIMVTIEELKEKIQEIKWYLDYKERAVPYSEIEERFFDGKEIPFNFNYEDYGIENFLFIKPKYNKLNYLDLDEKLFLIFEEEIPAFLESSENEQKMQIEKKYLLSSELFFNFLNFEFGLITKKNNGIIYFYSNILLEIYDDMIKYFFKENIAEKNFLILPNLEKKLLRFLLISKKFIFFDKYVINFEFFDKIKQDILFFSIIKFIRQYGPLSLEEIEFLIKKDLITNDLIRVYKNEIYDLLKSNKARFKWQKNGITKVQLTDDVEYLKSFIKNNEQDINAFKDIVKNSPIYRLFQSGIYALRFNGKNFPLKEAEEYIKTRPIVYIGKVYSINRLLALDSIELKNTEIWNFLSAILLKYDRELNKKESTKIDKKQIDEYVFDWLCKNLKISFYPDSEVPESAINQLIRDYSPLFNVKTNPGNLFSFTLENILKDYKQMINSSEDGR